MTVEQATVRKPPVGMILTLIAAVFLYALMMLCLADLANGGGDAMGRSIDAGLGLIFGCGLWLLLGVALLIGSVNGTMPVWAEVAAAILWPLSAVAAFVALDFVERGRGSAGSSYVLVPALLPPLVAAYALWARLPALQRRLSERATGIVVLGAIAVVALAPMPRYAGEQIERAREHAAEREAARQEAAREAERRRQSLERFNKLTADSPLWEWAAFFGKDSELDAQAIEGAKALPHRQTDAEDALRRGLGFPLIEYGRLDLEATPAFCTAAGDFLSQEAAAKPAPSPDAEYAMTTLPYLEADDIGAVEWLTGHCDIDAAIAQIRSTIEGYAPTRSRDAALGLIAWRRGNGFSRRQDETRALAEYDAAIRLSPDNEQFHFSRGNLRYGQGEYDKAIPDFSEAIRLNDGYSAAWDSRANCYYFLGDMEQALRDYDAAIDRNQSKANAYNNRGNVLAGIGEFDRAAADYDTALRLQPDMRFALNGRARVRFYQGDYARSAEGFAAELALKPDDAITTLWAYLARLRAGQPARERLREDAAKLDTAKWPWPIVAVFLGERDAAQVLADLAKEPDEVAQCDADFFLGVQLAAGGDAPRARLLFQHAATKCPPSYVDTISAKVELARLPP
ncbi:MAG: tetratricopeptide repeat protein [Alphaproteobacteria bacterium]|nr:tetratricopeptide repeat protein [Alphaproteobacteria bacterium]